MSIYSCKLEGWIVYAVNKQFYLHKLTEICKILAKLWHHAMLFGLDRRSRR